MKVEGGESNFTQRSHDNIVKIIFVVDEKYKHSQRSTNNRSVHEHVKHPGWCKM